MMRSNLSVHFQKTPFLLFTGNTSNNEVVCQFLGKRPRSCVRKRLQSDKEGREDPFGRQEEQSVTSGLNNITACEEDQHNQSPPAFVNSATYLSSSFLVAPHGMQWTLVVPGI